MKILLINPPWSLSAAAPINLAELAAYVIAKGYSTEILDLNYEISKLTAKKSNSKKLMEESLSLISRYSFDLIGITSNIVQFPVAKELIIQIKKRYKMPVVAGGVFAFYNSELFLGKGLADYVVRGEGEKVFVNLLNALACGKDPKKIKGLSYCQNGKVINNPPETPIKNLSVLPPPAFNLISNSILATDRLWLSAGRGCAYKCSFCSGRDIWQNQKMRPVESVIEQVKILKKKYKKNFLVFSDDCLALNKKWFEIFCAQIKKVKISWGCLTRIDGLDEKTIKMMAASGCVEIYHGIESASPKVRKKLNKSLSKNCCTNEDITSNVKLEISSGIKSICSFIINSPGETQQEMEQTFSFARGLKALGADTQCWILTSYKGTAIAKKYKTVKFDRWKLLKQRSIFGINQHCLWGNLINKHFKQNPDTFILRPKMGLRKFAEFYLKQKAMLEGSPLTRQDKLGLAFASRTLKVAKKIR